MTLRRRAAHITAAHHLLDSSTVVTTAVGVLHDATWRHGADSRRGMRVSSEQQQVSRSQESRQIQPRHGNDHRACFAEHIQAEEATDRTRDHLSSCAGHEGPAYRALGRPLNGISCTQGAEGLTITEQRCSAAAAALHPAARACTGAALPSLVSALCNPAKTQDAAHSAGPTAQEAGGCDSQT